MRDFLTLTILFAATLISAGAQAHGRVQSSWQGACREVRHPLETAALGCVRDGPALLTVQWLRGRPPRLRVLQALQPELVHQCLRRHLEHLPNPPQPCRARVIIVERK